MAMTIKELRDWLEGFNESALIGIDEGGLCLTVEDSSCGSTLNPAPPPPYIEIGGF